MRSVPRFAWPGPESSRRVIGAGTSDPARLVLDAEDGVSQLTDAFVSSNDLFCEPAAKIKTELRSRLRPEADGG